MARVVSVVSNGCNPDPRVLREAQWLADCGHEVKIHAFDRLANLPSSSEIGGVEIIRHRVGTTPYGSTWSTWRGIQRFLKSVQNSVTKVDLLHCHDADTLPLLKTIDTNRTLFDMHDLHHTWILRDRPNSFIRKLISERMKSSMLKQVKSADSIITSSPFFSEWLLNHGIQSSPVENRIENQEILPMPSKTTIGYFGKIRDVDSFDMLFQAMQSIKEEKRPKFILRGDGVSQSRVQKLVSNYTDLDIEISGPFTHRDLPKLMSEISIMFAMYPLRENILAGAIPSKMFEAAAFGRPSIVNGGAPVAKICDQESLGKSVKWGDISGLADAINTLDGQFIDLKWDAKREKERFLTIVDGLKI